MLECDGDGSVCGVMVPRLSDPPGMFRPDKRSVLSPENRIFSSHNNYIIAHTLDIPFLLANSAINHGALCHGGTFKAVPYGCGFTRQLSLNIFM